MRCEFTIAATLAAAPVLIVPRYFFSYDITPKIAVVLLGVSTALVLLLRAGIGAKLARLWNNPLGRAFCVLIAAHLASLLVSTAFSTHPSLSWNGGNWRRFGLVSQLAVIVCALIVAATFRASTLRIVLRAVSCAGIVVSLYGILQYFGVDPLIPPAAYRAGEGITEIVRPPSTLGHADYFAGYLVYAVFFGAALAAIDSSRGWKAVGQVASVAGSIAIVLSGTRGAMLALGAGAILFAMQNRPRLRLRHAAAAAALCTAAAVIFYLSPPGVQLRARSHWALDDLRGGARLLLWRDSLRMATGRPAIGFGPETFGLEFPQYQSAALSRAYPDFYHESPHNILLDALLSQGLPGLVILAGFVAIGWFAARRQPGKEARYLFAALTAGLISGVFVSFTFTACLYFYSTVALIVSLQVLEPSPEIAVRQTPVLVPIAAFAVIAVFLLFAVQIIASDVLLAQAKRDLDAARMADAIAAYAKSQRWHTAGSSDDLYFSRALAAASRSASPQAFTIAKRAVETSEERQNAWYNLAGFYATRGDLAGVETCLRRSGEASPNWFKPHWALAQALLLSGRRTEALAEAARAADLDGAKDAEIAKFLQSLHHPAAALGPK